MKESHEQNDQLSPDKIGIFWRMVTIWWFWPIVHIALAIFLKTGGVRYVSSIFYLSNFLEDILNLLLTAFLALPAVPIYFLAVAIFTRESIYLFGFLACNYALHILLIRYVCLKKKFFKAVACGLLIFLLVNTLVLLYLIMNAPVISM